jgi:hypothetical protein
MKEIVITTFIWTLVIMAANSALTTQPLPKSQPIPHQRLDCSNEQWHASIPCSYEI